MRVIEGLFISSKQRLGGGERLGGIGGGKAFGYLGEGWPKGFKKGDALFADQKRAEVHGMVLCRTLNEFKRCLDFVINRVAICVRIKIEMHRDPKQAPFLRDPF